MSQQPSQQIKRSLPTITITSPSSGRTVTWHMSQPVEIWSQSARKWCPGEISYITQDADGYCLDVRYWSKPQVPKAKYLSPLSDCLRPISSDFTCRTNWTSGSKVECFSNSQKRWYKATVVDVIRYPDDKEDWLKIQWSLDLSNDPNNTPQIMSKEVGRSSIWIRHRYPVLRSSNNIPPNLNNISSISSQTTPSTSPKKMNKKSRQKFKRTSQQKMENIIENINKAEKDFSYSIIDSYNQNNNNNIHKFNSQSQLNNSFISETSDRIVYSGPPMPMQSKPVSHPSQLLTPTLAPIEQVQSIDAMALNDDDDEFGAEYKPDSYQKKADINKMDEEMEMAFMQSNSPEFGAEFKPGSYKKKADMNELDLEMEKEFMESNSDNNEFGAEFKPDSYKPKEDMKELDLEMEKEFMESNSGSSDNDGSVVIKKTDDEYSGSGSSDSSESDSDKNDKLIIEQSETRTADSNDDEKKELNDEIDELKFRLDRVQQDLNEERVTSQPLLKEVEMQKIKIAKLQEIIHKLKLSSQSPSPSPSPSNAEPVLEDDEIDIKLAKFTNLNRRKHQTHQRSQSLQFIPHSNSDRSMLHKINENENDSNDKTQELIDAIYDRKVTLLNDQILRLQNDIKKRDAKLLEYKSKDKLRKREIQLLENELNDIKKIKNHRHLKTKSDQNINMYRDQVRKLTQTNDILKKALQSADDKLKLSDLKKQDLNEEYKIQRQIINGLQQKVQRVLQQNNTINNQIEHLISNNVYNNHLDTIRKCNVRAIQILHEIIQKNRRKQSDYVNVDNGYMNNEYDPYHSTKSTRFT